MQHKKRVIDITPPRASKIRREEVVPPASPFQTNSAEENPKVIFSHRAPTFFETPSPSFESFPPDAKRRRLPRGVRVTAFVVCAIVFTLVLFSVIGLWNLKKTIAETSPALYDRFKAAAHSLSKLEAAKAEGSLLNINHDMKSLADDANRYGIGAAAQLLGSAIPKLKAVPETFSNLAALSGAAISLAGSLADLEANGFGWLTARQGTKFTARLKTMEESSARIVDLATSLKNRSAELGANFGDDFVKLATELYRTDRFLKALVRWLEEYREKHLLVLFQNPSEMRPGGGFLGSFADVAIGPEGIRSIDVTDIYDPDGQLNAKIVPPKPLQAVTKNWGARDANWFFNFPTSAQKVIQFLEQSKIYRERHTSFDGVIAVNIRVLQSLLAITGPIPLPEYGFTVNAENMQVRLQREVETGNDHARGEPKRILKVLAPKILARLAALAPDQKRMLYDALGEHLRTRDLMFFAKDIEMQNYIEAAGAGGEVTRFPDGSPGEYLAVVAASIGGGKSDAFVTQKIKLSSRIDATGRVSNYLTIERTHTGDTKDDPWYRTTNRSYLQIMTPRGSRLTYLAGNNIHTIEAPLPYASLGYIVDPDLAAIEKTAEPISAFGAEQFEASGKTIFAAWLNLKAGAAKKIEAEYVNPALVPLGGDRIPYQFVFERQSGGVTSIDFLLEAPPGYHFAENKTPQFNYTDENPAGRVKVMLTLLKDQTGDQH